MPPVDEGVALRVRAGRGRGRRGRGATRMYAARRFADRHAALVMIGPALIVILAVLLYPLAYTVWLSLHNRTVGSIDDGPLTLERYAAVLQSDAFWHSMQVSGIFLLASVSLELVIGLGLALLLSRKAPGMGLLRGLIILPVLLSPVIVAILWKLLLNDEFGVFNSVLGTLGVGAQPWLSSETWAKVSIVLMDAWQWTPFMALLIAAGLSGLPPDPLEAAYVDGARPFQRFRLIVLPMLTKVLFVAVAFRIVFALATLASVLILNQGGPNQATNLFSLFVYQHGFQNFNSSYAAAASVLAIFIVLGLFAALFGPALRRWETGQ